MRPPNCLMRSSMPVRSSDSVTPAFSCMVGWFGLSLCAYHMRTYNIIYTH